MKLLFDHRESHDIDIFFHDYQLLQFMSPAKNDANDDVLKNFQEAHNFIKLSFLEGEIDFIVARQVSTALPQLKKMAGESVFVEDPIEIIAKKIAFRGDEFTPRDVFDLACVYKHLADKLIHKINIPEKQIKVLSEQIESIQKTGELDVG